MEQIVVEYDYPLLSVLIDDQKNRYISICYSVMDAQRWIIAPVSVSKLIGLLTNQVTLDDPYRTCDTNIILVVRNYETRAETFQAIKPMDIPDESLPDAGEYLDSEENEWSFYIQRLRNEWEPSVQSVLICINSILSDYRLRVARSSDTWSNSEHRFSQPRQEMVSLATSLSW